MQEEEQRGERSQDAIRPSCTILYACHRGIAMSLFIGCLFALCCEVLGYPVPQQMGLDYLAMDMIYINGNRCWKGFGCTKGMSMMLVAERLISE